MEELTEILTWSKLKLHNKPVGLLNVNGYYNHFLKWGRPRVWVECVLHFMGMGLWGNGLIPNAIGLFPYLGSLMKQYQRGL